MDPVNGSNSVITSEVTSNFPTQNNIQVSSSVGSLPPISYPHSAENINLLVNGSYLNPNEITSDINDQEEIIRTAQVILNA